MRIHEFNKSINEVGKVGEGIILNYLKSNPNIEQVQEVQDEKYYQELDIDFLAKTHCGSEHSIEVKTDTYLSGNLFYETMSCIETGSKGCMDKTKADYLFYYFIKSNELYMIKVKEFREWFYDNKSRFSQKKIKNKRHNGGIYTSEGYTIPKAVIEKEFLGYKKIIIEKSKYLS